MASHTYTSCAGFSHRVGSKLLSLHLRPRIRESAIMLVLRALGWHDRDPNRNNSNSACGKFPSIGGCVPVGQHCGITPLT